MIKDIQVDPSGEFNKQVRQWTEGVNDLTIPLNLIKESYFRSNNSIFAISGPGQWTDLSAKYKIEKEKKTGQIYPILFRSKGKVKSALTEEGSPYAVSFITGKRTLTLGVDKSDGQLRALFYGRKMGKGGIPARPYVLFGSEQTAPTELNTRVGIWQKILTDYVEKVLAKRGA